MEIMLEKSLRELLAKRGNTQSELAEHLSISTQAVSKWCRGENMPDIALLPKIASFLDVSVDELLGVGETGRREKIQEYRKKSYELSRKGLVAENIALWRDAYAELPNDTAVCEGLMHALCSADNEKYCAAPPMKGSAALPYKFCALSTTRGEIKKKQRNMQICRPIFL